MPQNKTSRQTKPSRPAGAETCDAEDVTFFRENRDRLQRQYGREFIAILDRQVVDSDSDYGRLEERSRKRQGDRRPFITYASSIPLMELVQRYPIESAAGVELDQKYWTDAADVKPGRSMNE